MAAIRILDCKAGVCTALGEIDVPDGERRVLAKSPDGDFSIDVVPFYINDGDGKPGHAEFAISAGSRTKTSWMKVAGFRSAPIEGAR